MKHVAAGVLDVAYLDTGPADGAPVMLLHGFPYDVHAYDAVAERLAAAGRRCIVPFLRGYGPTRFRSAETPRSGQQGALAADLLALMDALRIPQAVLAGYDWGGRAACIVAALRPERARGLVTCGTAYNVHDVAKASVTPAAPDQEHRSWYVYYFNTERGRAGLAAHRAQLCRLLWRSWSPTWTSCDECFARSLEAFDNPDFVDVVIHSYRHRIGNAPGDPAYTAIEQDLAPQPAIGVPTIVLQGAEDGVNPPQPRSSFAAQFTGRLEDRLLPGVGHNPPQEAPDAFAEAVLALE